MQEPAKSHQKERRCFHRSHTHLLAALTPLVIGEFVKDPEKKWRWIRIGAIVAAVVGEIEQSWQDKLRCEREEDRRQEQKSDSRASR